MGSIDLCALAVSEIAGIQHVVDGTKVSAGFPEHLTKPHPQELVAAVRR
jgi:hypothetical protein